MTSRSPQPGRPNQAHARVSRGGDRRKKTSGTAARDVFRTSPEPCRYFTEADVHALLTANPAGYLRFLKRALGAIARGHAQLTLPPKQVFGDTATGGDFRVMPCELREGSAVTKTVKIIGTNTIQKRVRDQITVGRLLVIDPRENFVSAVMEACLFSSARTGACAALALDALARKRGNLLVVGSGRVGVYSAYYALAAGGVRQVTFCDRVAARADRAARWLAGKFPRVRCRALLLDSVESADVVVIATTSETPVASPPAWGASLVVSLGADADSQSELDPAWARCADLYCDTLDSLRFGDLRAWTESGLADATAVTDLLGVIRRPPPASERVRVFVSTGSALFDNLTARYLLEKGPG